MSIEQLEAVIDLLVNRERPENPTVEESRDGFERLARYVGGDTPASAADVNANGVRGEMVRAESATGDGVALYLHGGGYVVGSPATHRELARRLSAETGGDVLTIDYRMAPEDPFPAPVEDATAAYEWPARSRPLRRQRIHRRRLRRRRADGGDAGEHTRPGAAHAVLRRLPVAVGGHGRAWRLDGDALRQRPDGSARGPGGYGRRLSRRRRPALAPRRAHVRRPDRAAAAADTGRNARDAVRRRHAAGASGHVLRSRDDVRAVAGDDTRLAPLRPDAGRGTAGAIERMGEFIKSKRSASQAPSPLTGEGWDGGDPNATAPGQRTLPGLLASPAA